VLFCLSVLIAVIIEFYLSCMMVMAVFFRVLSFQAFFKTEIRSYLVE